MRRAASLLCLAGALLATLGLLPAHAQERARDGGPVVEVFEASGVLDASVLGALRHDLAGAQRRGAEVFLIQVSSFGGLGVDPGEVRRAVAEAEVPVALWVGPRAAEAAGTATFLLSGADVVAVSRDARVGPALPAELGRGRDPVAEAALFAGSGLPAAVERSSLVGAAAEAAGLADYQAESLPDAVRRLDGRTADGNLLDVTGFRVRFLSRSLLDRVRHGLANPTLAYLLLLAAAACLAFEWFQPGFGVAGAAGVACALLAAFSLAVLPTNWLALAVLLAGQALFTVDAAMGGLGLGTAGAAALTAAGSWWLFASPSPLLRVDGRLAVLGVLWSLAWFVVILTVILRSQRQPAMGTQALVGSRGVVRSMLNPGGIVVVDGAMWRARLAAGDGSLGTGQRIRVAAVVDGVLQVEPEDPAAVRPSRRRGRRVAEPAGHE
ncbi:MAG TPA: NfeD family protein [Actinomycetes bacterium]|nr:NfeD family protein [Actinomycetes bacterium]